MVSSFQAGQYCPNCRSCDTNCSRHHARFFEVAEVLENRAHPATSLLNRKVIKDLFARPLETTSSLPERAGLERARSISAWVKDYGVGLDL